jgi:hypothetical protein
MFPGCFLEILVKDSNFYKLQIDNNLIGYAIVPIDNILVELHINNRYLANGAAYFLEIIETLQINSIYCKS